MQGNPRNEQWFLRRRRLQKSDQKNQETLVCNFIDAVTFGTVSSPDDIYFYGRTDRSSSSSGTSIKDKAALAVSFLGTVCLAIYSVMLHKKLTKPKGDLVPGGALHSSCFVRI